LSELPGLIVDPPIELLDDALFDQRLQELGYPADSEFSFEYLDKTHVIYCLIIVKNIDQDDRPYHYIALVSKDHVMGKS